MHPAAVAVARSRWARRVLIGCIVFVVALCGVVMAGVLAMFAGGALAATLPVCGSVAPMSLGPSPELEEVQSRNAQIIVAVGLKGVEVGGQVKPVPRRALELAVGVASQESGIRNLANGGKSPNLTLAQQEMIRRSLQYPHDGVGNDWDSVNAFQQRTLAGWGTIEQLMDPEYAAAAFYKRLLTTVPNFESLAFTVAAQKVQGSAFPHAYADDELLAKSVVEALLSGRRASNVQAALVEDSSGAWVYPAGITEVGTGFGAYAGHSGVDFEVPTGTEIVAVHRGRVARSEFVTRPDGSPSYGFTVVVEHPGGFSSLYGHNSRLLVRPGQAVEAGTVIALAGSTGRSSGPHLHFEIQLRGSAFDPIPFLRARGATVVDGAGGRPVVADSSEVESAGVACQPARDDAAIADGSLRAPGAGPQDPRTHLTPRATYLGSVVRDRWGCNDARSAPCVTTIGGWRPHDAISPDHPSGRAVDVMIGRAGQAAQGADKALGDSIAAFLVANADALEIDYLIWDQEIWTQARSAEGWRAMATRGSHTQDHRDHVHISIRNR